MNFRFLVYKNGGAEQIPKGKTVGAAADIGNGTKSKGGNLRDAINGIYDSLVTLRSSSLKDDSSADGATVKDALDGLSKRLSALEAKVDELSA